MGVMLVAFLSICYRAGPIMRRALPTAAIVLAALGLWGALGDPPLPVGLLIWFAALWLPGAALTLPASVPFRNPEALWLPLATGPVCFGVLVTLGRLAGISLEASALGAVLLGAAALLLRILRTGPGRGNTRVDASPIPWLPLLAGSAILLAALWPPLTHSPLRWRDDALLHLPIIERILAGSFPPENPFLAGAPLAYFWFVHVTLAGVSRLSHIPLEFLFPLLSAQGLALVLLALERVAHRLGLSPLGRAATLVLVGIGFTPWGWMHFLYLRITHPELNWPLLRVSGSSVLFPVLNPFDPRLVASLTKVAITNALPISLGLAAVALWPPSGPGPRGWIVRGIATAGCLLFHVVTGVLLVAGLAGRWFVARIRTRGSCPELGGRLPLLSLLAAVILTIPYLLLVMGARTGTEAVRIGWQGGKGLGLEAALAGLFLLALPALWTWRRRPLPWLWLSAGIPALLLPYGAHLVDGNEYKAVFFLLLLLSPVAGAGVARLSGERPLLALVLLLPFLPTPYLAARAYLEEVPPGTLTAEERRLVGEATADLPEEAVLWKPEEGTGYYVLTAPLRRAFFLSDPYALQIMGQWDGEEARWRRGSLQLVREGRYLEAVGAAQERIAPRPLYVVVNPSDVEDFPRFLAALRGAGAQVVVSNPAVAILSLPTLRPKP